MADFDPASIANMDEDEDEETEGGYTMTISPDPKPDPQSDPFSAVEDRLRRSLDTYRHASEYVERVCAVGHSMPLTPEGRSTAKSREYERAVIDPAWAAKWESAREVVATIRDGRDDDEPSNAVVLDGRVYVAFGYEIEV